MSTELTTLFGSGTSTVTGRPLGRSVARATKREVDAASGRAEVAYATDQARAFLTASALSNVVTLVGAAEQFMQVAPGGAHYYELLINAYGVGAAQSIARFQ